MLLQETISQIETEIPKEAFWSVITILLGFIGWVGLRYYNRLETILDRLDTAIEGIITTQALIQSEQGHIKETQGKHDVRISKLEDSNKNRRRGNA